LGKNVSCANTHEPILTIYTSCDLLLRKELYFGIAKIALASKILAALIF